MADFASMLKYLRERDHLSQRELAERLNISKSTISMYENGQRHPKFEDEEAIADFFNVDLNTLRGKQIPEEDIEVYERAKRIVDVYSLVPPEVLDDSKQYAQIKDLLNTYLNSDSDGRSALVGLLKSLQPKS